MTEHRPETQSPVPADEQEAPAPERPPEGAQEDPTEQQEQDDTDPERSDDAEDGSG